jgi:hypothetical protein
LPGTPQSIDERWSLTNKRRQAGPAYARLPGVTWHERRLLCSSPACAQCTCLCVCTQTGGQADKGGKKGLRRLYWQMSLILRPSHPPRPVEFVKSQRKSGNLTRPRRSAAKIRRQQRERLPTLDGTYQNSRKKQPSEQGAAPNLYLRKGHLT